MVYEVIELQYVLPNPYQTRKTVDEEEIDALAESASDRLGIRNVPLVRPHPSRLGYYEVAGGWRRIQALRKRGVLKTILRVEEMSDAEMRKEVVVENFHRRGLDEDELYVALKQIRGDLSADSRSNVELSRATGVSPEYIAAIFDAHDIKPKLNAEAPVSVIKETRTLGDEVDRIALINKSVEQEWGQRKTSEAAQAVNKMGPEARREVLRPESNLEPRVLTEVAKLPREKQLPVIKEAELLHLNTEDAVRMVQRVQAGTEPQVTVTLSEAGEVMGEITDAKLTIFSWGINQYGILGEKGWAEACAHFSQMEDRLKWLRRRGWEKQ